MQYCRRPLGVECSHHIQLFNYTFVSPLFEISQIFALPSSLSDVTWNPVVSKECETGRVRQRERERQRNTK